MNEQIINNLYELWEQVGNLTNKLSKTENYSTVSMDDSDWPNRIFNLKNNTKAFDEILQLSKEGKLPEIITITKPNDLKSNPNFDFLFGQKNMALDLKSYTNELSASSNIKRVKSKKDSIDFAKTASESFGYKVDFNVVYKIVNDSETIQLFIYQEKNECLGCGIVFFDSNNNAGLHMIGTISKGRGKGIGKSMTERLLIEAKKNNMNFCVLHASLMGESIYRKLGFESYKEIETYKILKKQ
ncbi:MAG: GNAT family N-acetyltransferase [Bacteroidales bacterium]|nr:GNAT family N-acetyltransferase [Bacteroidales bacterium]